MDNKQEIYDILLAEIKAASITTPELLLQHLHGLYASVESKLPPGCSFNIFQNKAIQAYHSFRLQNAFNNHFNI